MISLVEVVVVVEEIAEQSIYFGPEPRGLFLIEKSLKELETFNFDKNPFGL